MEAITRHTCKGFLLSVLVVILSIFMLGGAVPAQADDGSAGTEASPIEFFDVTPYGTYHEDADPFKGSFQIYAKNSTANTWIGFNFTLTGSNVVFIDNSLWDPYHPGDECSTWPDGTCNPSSGKGISSYSISPDQKSMSVYFSTNWTPTQKSWVKVYTDNTASQGAFTISGAPIVPEPISSTLFLVGAATLGFRRFRKK